MSSTKQISRWPAGRIVSLILCVLSVIAGGIALVAILQGVLSGGQFGWPALPILLGLLLWMGGAVLTLIKSLRRDARTRLVLAMSLSILGPVLALLPLLEVLQMALFYGGDWRTAAALALLSPFFLLFVALPFAVYRLHKKPEGRLESPRD